MKNQDNRAQEICKYIKNVIDKEPMFAKYWDSKNENQIDIATWMSFPDTGFSLNMTINLSFYPLIRYGELYTKSKCELLGTRAKINYPIAQ